MLQGQEAVYAFFNGRNFINEWTKRLESYDDDGPNWGTSLTRKNSTVPHVLSKLEFKEKQGKNL